MRFTEKEILFLTSVSKGRVPFGITYHMPEQDKRERYIEETILSLKKKAFIDDTGKLTPKGADIIYFWERYRNCKRHIRLNQLNIAILPENLLIIVVQGNEEFEMVCTNREALMLDILKHTEILCRQEIKEDRGKWQDMDGELFMKEVEEMDGYILLYEYLCGRLESEKIYYWKGTKGYLYNKSSGRMRSLSPGTIRKQIYRALREEDNYE